MKKETIHISGMHCASCVNTIESALYKNPAIEKANVNFSSKKASIEYDENEITLEEIFKIISDTGYTPEKND